MNKSKYIGKYDYVGYYTKQPALWFFSNSEIISGIETEIKKAQQIDLDDDEDDDDVANSEFDAYEYYKEALEDNAHIDDLNPKIQEGIIIDNSAKQYIRSLYPEITTIIDFDDLAFRYKKQEERAQDTEDILTNNNQVILFQPVFIHQNLITKPDAIIKQDEHLTLIETKGTSTSKIHHALDIYFQSKLLRACLYLDNYYFDYKLCLVKYCKANKYEVKLTTTDYFNYSKAVAITNVNSSEQKSQIKLGYGIYDKKENLSSPITLNCICNDSIEDFDEKLSLVTNAQTIKSINRAKELFLNIFAEFDKVINTLIEHKKNMLLNNDNFCLNIKPSFEDKSDFKINDYFLLLRKIYQSQGYELFNYTGNLVCQTKDRLIDLPKVINLEDYVKNTANGLFPFNNPITIVRENANPLWAKLKTKKVYFDFETINTSIRSLDNTYPFMQMVTQCSIIKHLDSQIQTVDLHCNNILIDPKIITIDDYKQIVDELYEGPDCSYVVYNKTFECNRLKEFKEYIQDENYSQKIDVINNNIFDLAEFFRVSKNKAAIVIAELGGFYSIKKVLPYIQKHHSDIYNQTGCKDYNDLEIGNGLDCQNLTTMRFLSNYLSNTEWEKLVNNMKIYCENDVRAMIAVEYFVKMMLK